MTDPNPSDESVLSFPRSRFLPAAWQRLLQEHPWLVFLLPMVVYLVVGSFEPSAEAQGESAGGWGIGYEAYPLIYAAKILLTTIAVLLVLPGYAGFRFRISWLALGVGIVGAVLWVGICKLQLESMMLTQIGWGQALDSAARSAFNPFHQFPDRPVAAWGFMALRLLGMVALVPIIEEFFLRGLVMRYVMSEQWWRIPFGQVNATAVAAGTIVPMLLHPAELIAAAVWFSLVTWLMVRTRSMGDCILAHAVTNLLLAVYVLISGDWWLM